MSKRAFGWLVGAACVPAYSVFAFVTNIGPPWPDGNVVLHLQLGISPLYSDGTNPNLTAAAALQHWNGYMGRVQLVANSGSSANKKDDNGINNVFFSSTTYGMDFSPGVLAITLISSNDTHRTETDVIVNSDWIWNSYRGPLAPSGDIDLRRVLIHEFGHVLGLGHPDEAGQYVRAIMNSQVSHIDGTTQDDQDGAASLYGRGIDNPAIAPTIPVSEPYDQTAESGSYVTFYVTVEGTTPLTFQWYKDGVAISGATEKRLKLESVRPTDSGGYSVRVSNEAGSVTSRTAKLTVHPPKPPSIPAGHPQDLTVTESVRVGWIVNVSGTEPITFQWRKDGVDIPGATSNDFFIDPVHLSDAGMYSLQATNEAGTILSREARLQVDPGQPPTIAAWPEPTSTTVGLSAALYVDASSPLPLTYQWLKDGQPVPSATDSRLDFSPVVAEDEGEYAVVVSTEFGSVTSPAVSLSVYPALIPPTTVARARDRTVTAGEFLYLSGQRRTLEGRLTYQWYRDGHPIPGENSRSYLVASASPADEGEYYVVVGNDTGSTASTKVFVTVEPAAVPDRDWLSYERHDDIVYFLFANPARIERFSVPADAFLPPVTLPRTPTAMTVHDGRLVVAFGSQISRFPLAGGNETALGTGPDVIACLAGHGDYLFGLADTHDDGDSLFSFSIQTGAIVQSIELSYRNAPSLLVDPVNQRVILRTASPPGIPVAINFAPDGTFFIGGPQGEIYRGGLPHDRMYLSPDSSHLLVQAGTVYRTSDLTFVDAVGEHFDDAAFLPDGRVVVLRKDELVSYSASWAKIGTASLALAGDAIAAEGSEMIVFIQPPTAGAPIGWRRISLDQFLPEEPPPEIDSDHLLIEPNGVWLAADGNVLIYSREHQHVLRWSIDEQKYLDPIPILGDAERVWYSRDYDRLYISYPDRKIRTMALDGPATEEYFASSAESLLELAEMGEHLLLVENLSGGLSFRFLARDGQQTAVETSWAEYSESYAWNAAKRRLHYFDARSSARPLEWIELLADGTVGERASMPSYLTALENLRPPVFVSPAGDMLLLGSGRFFDAETFEEKPFGLANRVDDAVWQGTTLFTATSRLYGVEVQRWDETDYGLERTRILPGRLLRIFVLNSNQLLVVTSHIAEVNFTILDYELTVQGEFPGARTPNNRLINISTRGEVGSDSMVMIAGFVISGNTPQRVLIRAVGPTLESFNVSGVLEDPMLTIFDRNSLPIASNDDWGESDFEELVNAFEAAGAFPLPAGSTDAALIQTLAPGSYTAVVEGKNHGIGVALVEAYDLDPTASEHRLVNISTRAWVGDGSAVLIPGLVIAGPEPKRLLIRAIGPGLVPFGVSRDVTLGNPSLEVVDRHGGVVAANNNWGRGNPSAVRWAGTATGAFALPSGSADAALVVLLAPGQYTVVVQSAGTSRGVALVEAYEIP